MDLFEYAQAQADDESEDAPAAQPAIYSVTEVTSEVRSLLTRRFGLEPFWVKGEISNYKGRNQSGHMYFSLKDEKALLNCVFFRGSNTKLKVELREGVEVLALGRMDVWEKGGRYQLIIEEIRPGGTGELYLRFEQLKKKLEAEGLFAPERKRPLPEFPKRIGLVTSPTGAVLRDIIHVTRRRCPSVTLLLKAVKVQGDGAKDEIAQAIELLNDPAREIDLLIVGRGGGSIEDLWAFNEEVVARAIANSRVPVISAVGHQTDFTIADFVADIRAATPSQAAEMAVPNVAELAQRIDLLVRNIVRELLAARKLLRERVENLTHAMPLRDPRMFIRSRAQQVDFAVERMMGLIVHRRQSSKHRLQGCNTHLRSLLSRALGTRRLQFEKVSSNLALLNPLAVLSRGYSVVRMADGKIVKRANQVEPRDKITVRLHEGELSCQVLQTFEKPSKL